KRGRCMAQAFTQWPLSAKGVDFGGAAREAETDHLPEPLMDTLTVDRDAWNAAGEALLEDAIALRRAIHEEPELGLDLPKTTAKVRKALEGLPLEIRQGPSTSGLIAIL